ncbi:MAG TPA: hypothetical protein PKH77_18390 [Anaerolineae bacterium]|nr:hypothetical protein [Anaerolineae bacterium]
MNPVPETPPAPPPPDSRSTPTDDQVDYATARLVRRAWLYKLAQIKRKQNQDRPPLWPASEDTPADDMPSLPDT